MDCESNEWVHSAQNRDQCPAVAKNAINLQTSTKTGWGTWWCSWLRHCATSRKVASSIPDDAIVIFHWHNPSGRTMALGSTQPLTEMSTTWPVRMADNLTTFMCRLSWNLGASTSWNPQGLSRPVMGLLYIYQNRVITTLYKEPLFSIELKPVRMYGTMRGGPHYRKL
jgi:hypothetical protein